MARLNPDGRATLPGRATSASPHDAGGRPRRARVLLGCLLAVAVAAPFVWAAAARTSAPPRQPPPQVGQLPTGGRPVDLSSQVDHVPMLDDDVPDVASRAAADAYRRAGIFDAGDVKATFLAAWQALRVPPDARPALDRFGAALLDSPIYESLPEGAEVVLEALASDPDNGARLTNAAIMLFGHAVLIDSGIAPGPEGTDYAYAAVVEEQAILLLDAVAEHFGSSREQALAEALFVSVTNTHDGIERAERLAAPLVRSDPADLTARWVLSNLQARRMEDGRGYEDAVATLRPLLDDPDTRLLGTAATGDAFLAAASLRAADAPRTSAVLARRAIDQYDTVLDEVADPGVYAGRARALALLGDTNAAVPAMQEAVERAPEAVDPRLELASLQQAAGDIDAMGETARGALALTSVGWNPRLSDARLVSSVLPSGLGFAHPGDLGMFGQSVGSTRDHVAVIRFPQGGGFVAGIEVVPRIIDPELDAWRRGGLAPDVAARLAVDASVALGRPDEVADAIDTWLGQQISTSQQLFDDVYGQLETGQWAASLVAGDGLAQAAIDDFRAGEVLAAAEAALRRGGDFRRLETLCRGLLESGLTGGGSVDGAAAWRCLGDALVLRGRHGDAVETFSDAADELGLGISSELLLRWGAERLAVEPGDEEGRRLLQRAAVQGGAEGATALVRLGIDDLEHGRAAVARAHYDLALSLLDPDSVDSSDQAAASRMRQARGVALTNRGVALLRLAQDDPTRPPACHPDADDDLCRDAAADFSAVLSVDPLNAVALMNQAWADRAMGEPLAARHALAAAVGADPSLYPAANDLGVLAARSGDTGAARRAFRTALAVNPDYALGWWNIGVLELREQPTHWRAGQAALAEAVRLDPSLAGRALDYRTDEAVYRTTFDSVEEVSSEWAVGRSYGIAASVLGGVGLISALGRFGNTFLASVWDTLLSLAGTYPKKRSPWRRRFSARAAAVRRRFPTIVRPWLPWMATGAALLVISAWTVWRREPGSAVAALVSVVVATIAALGAHEGGHLLAMRRWGGRLVPAQWAGGVVLALVLLPVQASSGPYLAERLDGVADKRLARIHVAGPLANLALAAGAYLFYLAHPVPLLLLTSQVSVAVSAYTLLPNLPLDGEPLRKHPLAAAVLGLVITAAGVAFATNAA